MTGRQALLLLAGALIVVGVVLGLRGIHADDVACGSVFSPSSAKAKLADESDRIYNDFAGDSTPGNEPTKLAACHSAISDAKPLAYGALGLGVIALIASFVVPVSREDA